MYTFEQDYFLYDLVHLNLCMMISYCGCSWSKYSFRMLYKKFGYGLLHIWYIWYITHRIQVPARPGARIGSDGDKSVVSGPQLLYFRMTSWTLHYIGRMFCPSKGWLCWWQEDVKGLVGVTIVPIRYRSTHVIPTLYFSKLIWDQKSWLIFTFILILSFIFYRTIHCGFVIYANLTRSNKLLETSILFQSFKVNIDRLGWLRLRNGIFSVFVPINA